MKKKKKNGNGEGTIYFNSRLNKWTAQFSQRGKRQAIYGNSRAEVAEKLNRKLLNIRDNKSIDKSKVTIRNILELILENEIKQNLIKESTYVRNKQTSNIILKMYIADIPLQLVSVEQIEECLADLIYDYSNSSIDKVYLKLSSIFKKAKKLNIISENPFANDDVTKPKSMKDDKDIEALTVEEQQALMQTLSKKDYLYRTSNLYYAIYGNEDRRSTKFTQE